MSGGDKSMRGGKTMRGLLEDDSDRLLESDSLIKRIQLALAINSLGGYGQNGIEGFGRIGYRHPIGSGGVTLGISGHGSNVSNYGDRTRSLKPSGVDISWDSGGSSVGGSYSFGDNPMLMLNYRKMF